MCSASDFSFWFCFFCSVCLRCCHWSLSCKHNYQNIIFPSFLLYWHPPHPFLPFSFIVSSFTLFLPSFVLSLSSLLPSHIPPSHVIFFCFWKHKILLCILYNGLWFHFFSIFWDFVSAVLQICPMLQFMQHNRIMVQLCYINCNTIESWFWCATNYVANIFSYQ